MCVHHCTRQQSLPLLQQVHGDAWGLLALPANPAWVSVPPYQLEEEAWDSVAAWPARLHCLKCQLEPGASMHLSEKGRDSRRAHGEAEGAAGAVEALVAYLFFCALTVAAKYTEPPKRMTF